MKWWLTHKGSKKETYIWAKNVIYTVHELGIIVNKRSIKQVKTKKKLLGKLCACNSKLGTLLNFDKW